MKYVIHIIRDIFAAFFNKSVGRSAAALSYYLTLSVFPFLICTSVILGTLSIQETDAFALLEGIIPEAAFNTLSDYLKYISGTGSEVVFTVGLTAMLTSSSAAFRSFTGIMGEIQGKMRFSGILGWLISIVFSIMFLAAIYASAIVILLGEWFMQIISTQFALSEVATVWRWIRFVLLFLLLFFVIYSVYLISAPKQTTRMSRLPGALVASVILVGSSIVFSQLITASIRYEVLYGSLASFIILMVWLYICSFILIVANVINISVSKQKEVKNAELLPEPQNDKRA